MNYRQSLAQLLMGVFLFAFLFPISNGKLSFLSSPTTGGDLEVAVTLWNERLPEIYLQIIFLGAAVIASLLVIRKPPSYHETELQKYGMEES